MALVLEQEYLIALREFSIHFNDKITKSTISMHCKFSSPNLSKYFVRFI